MVNRITIQNIRHTNWTAPNYKINIVTWMKKFKLTKLNFWKYFKIQQNWLWTGPLFHLWSLDHYHHKTCPGGRSTCLPGSSTSHTPYTCTWLPPGVQLSQVAQLWFPQSQWLSTWGVTSHLFPLDSQTQNVCKDQCWYCSGPSRLFLFQPTWNTHPWCSQHTGVNRPGPHRGTQTTSACFSEMLVGEHCGHEWRTFF